MLPVTEQCPPHHFKQERRWYRCTRCGLQEQFPQQLFKCDVCKRRTRIIVSYYAETGGWRHVCLPDLPRLGVSSGTSVRRCGTPPTPISLQMTLTQAEQQASLTAAALGAGEIPREAEGAPTMPPVPSGLTVRQAFFTWIQDVERRRQARVRRTPQTNAMTSVSVFLSSGSQSVTGLATLAGTANAALGEHDLVSATDRATSA